MNEAEVIAWRARALYNKFWEELPNNPQWLRQILQNNPGLFAILVEAIRGDQGSQVNLRQQIEEIARQEAEARATTQVQAGLTTEQIADTLKYL